MCDICRDIYVHIWIIYGFNTIYMICIFPWFGKIYAYESSCMCDYFPIISANTKSHFLIKKLHWQVSFLWRLSVVRHGILRPLLWFWIYGGASHRGTIYRPSGIGTHLRTAAQILTGHKWHFTELTSVLETDYKIGHMHPYTMSGSSTANDSVAMVIFIMMLKG